MERDANPPPFDRALVLAATVGALAPLRCWLETCCRCGACVHIPLLFLAERGQARRTVADVLLRLRCKRCGEAPAKVDLLENLSGPGIAAYGGKMPWRVELLCRP